MNGRVIFSVSVVAQVGVFDEIIHGVSHRGLVAAEIDEQTEKHVLSQFGRALFAEQAREHAAERLSAQFDTVDYFEKRVDVEILIQYGENFIHDRADTFAATVAVSRKHAQQRLERCVIAEFLADDAENAVESFFGEIILGGASVFAVSVFILGGRSDILEAFHRKARRGSSVLIFIPVARRIRLEFGYHAREFDVDVFAFRFVCEFVRIIIGKDLFCREITEPVTVGIHAVGTQVNVFFGIVSYFGKVGIGAASVVIFGSKLNIEDFEESVYLRIRFCDEICIFGDLDFVGFRFHALLRRRFGVLLVLTFEQEVAVKYRCDRDHRSHESHDNRARHTVLTANRTH